MTDFPGEVDFVGPGVEVRLTPEGPRSHLEIRLKHDQAHAVHLEVLLVPRDEHGLARGAPTAIYVSTWPLRRLEGHEPALVLSQANPGRFFWSVDKETRKLPVFSGV